MNNDVRQVFKSLDKGRLRAYHAYWDTLRTRDEFDHFRRFLFAFCSVHTTWKSNVRGYEAIRDFNPASWSKTRLYSALAGSGCGMHNNRTNYIWAFGEDYWATPWDFVPMDGESIAHLRNRLVKRIRGLGWAKVSFALEMAYPSHPDLNVACLDVHMLRLYGNAKLSAGSKAGAKKYQQYEADWCGRSQDLGYGPYVARMVYWDSIQDKESSRYWSYVLEDDQQKADEADGGCVAGNLPGESRSASDVGRYGTAAHTEGRAQDEELHRGTNNKNEGDV